MKIRYYQKIDGWRWLGWGIASLSCSIWICMGIKDRDIPRTLMEFMYLILALRAIWNWLT